jgi:hypothetical protein
LDTGDWTFGFNNGEWIRELSTVKRRWRRTTKTHGERIRSKEVIEMNGRKVKKYLQLLQSSATRR